MKKHTQAKWAFTIALLSLTSFANGQVGKWESIDEANTWLNSSIATIRQDDKTYNQEAKIDKGNHNHLTLTVKETDPKGSVNTSYEFYLGHLDAAKTTFEIKGTQINVMLHTLDDLKVVKHKVEGSFKGYQDDLIIRCDDPQLAKDIVTAVNYLIGKSPSSSPGFSNQTEAIDWLTKNIKNVEVTGEKVEQKFQFFPDQRNKLVLTVTEINSKGQTAWEYTFYANDFNGASGKMSVEGEKLALKFTTTDNQMMVKIFKDGEQQKFNKYFELFSNDAKAGLDILSAFKTAFGKSTDNAIQKNETEKNLAPKENNPNSTTQNCAPFYEGNDNISNYKYLLYGGLAGKSSGGKAFMTNESEGMQFAVGYLNDATLIVWIQYGKTYYKDSSTPIKDLSIKTGDKLNIVTSNGGLTFTALNDESSVTETKVAGVSVTISQTYSATKEQIQQLSKSTIQSIRINFAGTSAYNGVVDAKNEKTIKEQIACFLNVMN